MPGREDSNPPRETHVKPTDSRKIEDAESLYWEERRLLEKKLKAWLNGEYREARKAWIGIRVTPTVKEVYDRAPDQVKRAARRAFEAVLIAWFLGEEQVRMQGQSGAPQIFNVNISVSEARADARAEARSSVEGEIRVAEVIEAMERLIGSLWRQKRIDMGAAKQLLGKLKELKEVLGVN